MFGVAETVTEGRGACAERRCPCDVVALSTLQMGVGIL